MIGRFTEEEKDYLLSLLPQFITDSRLKRIHEVLAQRTTHLTLVLEDIFQSHNAAAIIRTAEAYGLQEVHVLENRNQFHQKNGLMCSITIRAFLVFRAH
jgi:tRNA (guanosine-2'-O-)-methyltransferase